MRVRHCDSLPVSRALQYGDDTAVVCRTWSCAGLESEHVRYPRPARIGLHAHDTATFVMVTSGRLAHLRRAAAETMGAGSVLFVPGRTPHAGAALSAGAECASVDVHRTWIDRHFSDAPSLPLEPLVLAEASAPVRALLEEFSGVSPSEAAVGSLMVAMIREAVRQSERAAVPRWLVLAREILREQSRATIDIQHVARQVEIHPAHLSRAFHRYFGLTITSFVMQLRVERARRALATTAHSIGAIGVAQGFCDHAYFTRTFHRYVGESPSSFRRRLARFDRHEGPVADHTVAHVIDGEAGLQKLR